MDLHRVFFVVLRHAGPQWDPSQPMEKQSDWPAHASFMDGLVDAGFVVLGGPLADEHRVVLVVEAESEDAVRSTLARDPWSETHLPDRHDRSMDNPARRAARLGAASPRPASCRRGTWSPRAGLTLGPSL